MKGRITLIFFISCFLWCPLYLWAQQVEVTGRVTLKSDGSPLPGVTITVRGTRQATSSNESGNFRIGVPRIGSILVFSQIGMLEQNVTVSSSSPLNVVLTESTSALNEVIVVGYGTQRKSLVTGAISSVRAEELKTVSSGRIDQALQGRTAGVNIMPNSGSPGAAISIRVRGTGSNRASEPLYIVDGVRAGGIEYIDPSEIAAIEILKDAASAAIYGAEGANGVIIITTKTGKLGMAPVANYAFQYGEQSLGRKLSLMNAPQYQQYLAEGKLTGPSAQDAATIGDGTDWIDAVTQTAPQQHHTINFSGGSDKSTYLISGTYFTQQGIIGGDKSKFDRYTFRVNSDNKVKSWLNVGERLSYSNFTSHGLSENTEYGSVVGSMLSMDPFTPVTYTGDLPAFVQSKLGNPLVKDANGNYYGISQYVQGEFGNPLAIIQQTQSRTNQNKLVGNVFADIDLFKGLKFTTRFGIDAAFVRTHGWNPTSWYSSERLNSTANGFDSQTNYFNWQWENFANYTRSFGNHNLTFLLGTSSLKNLYNNVGGSYTGIFKEEDKWAYPEFVSDTPEKLAKLYGYYRTETLLSYYSRLNYDYKNKYLFGATIRRDGSSKFYKDNRWGTFPSISAGWVISKEDFYTAGISKAVNYLKLRGSWGQNGSLSNVGNGSWAASITQAQKYADGNGNFVLGAAPSNLPNYDLTWETSEQLDLGLDANFFNNQLVFSADWYKKTTKDLITNGSAPYFAGNVLNDVNSGNVVNKGWEFELTYHNANTNDFKYEIAGNISPISNEVTYTNPLYPVIFGAGVGTGWQATRFEKGLPIWYFYGYKTDGIFQNQAEITKYIADNGLTGYNPKPGDPIIVDVDGNKIIAPTDQTNIGNSVPDFTYGARINLSYKGFDFLAFLQGSKGNDVILGFVRNDRRTSNLPEFFYTDRWTGDGSTNTWFAPNADARVYNSDMMVFDGSYARIRQMQLGYTLPNTLLSKLSVKNARFYVSLDDFFTFTKYKGLDPEGGNNGGNSIGIDRGSYPVSKKILAGLSFNF
ncbi:SusC/RagA family TonB-linked outer membrane protein [Arcticibacter eurypsychrophilus]|uniref:SusC/RagA family TonB-linked outer membrane protein n=1 Tax=Arcticibacter eurypsychrophilus TaxID=1434752 RepID=UPI00084D39F4|nr:TonB-dependent receptor [Arcticibacter eurypsychrophilus]